MLLTTELIAIAVLITVLFILIGEEGRIRGSRVPKGTIKEYWNGRERRKAFRISASLVVKYYIEKKSSIRLNGYTKDLSSGGVRLLIKEKLSNGTVLLLEFGLPEPEGALSIQGEVIWSEGTFGERDDLGRRIFQTGIQFVNMSAEDKNKLSTYIEKCRDEKQKKV